MKTKKEILVLVGSASQNSSNQKLVDAVMDRLKHRFQFTVYPDLKALPPFDPALSASGPPAEIQLFRDRLERADGVLICSPEYIFSIPSALKNVFEWCVATTLFTDKPTGFITASASGEKGHAELQLILQTLMARLSETASLLIQGIKAKIDKDGVLLDPQMQTDLEMFIGAFAALVEEE